MQKFCVNLDCTTKSPTFLSFFIKFCDLVLGPKLIFTLIPLSRFVFMYLLLYFFFFFLYFLFASSEVVDVGRFESSCPLSLLHLLLQPWIAYTDKHIFGYTSKTI